MIYEIVGTGFGNKGAELMLASILAKLKTKTTDIRFAVRPSIGSYESRSRYGLLQVFDPRRAGRLGWILERMMHQGYRATYGLVSTSDLDGVLDASGYALCDPWRPEWIEQKAGYYETLRARGKLIILLPQAIGPVETPRVRSAVRRVLASANIVFARDVESFEIARSLVNNSAHIHMAPDFTCLLPGRIPVGFSVIQERVALIPNNQMLVHQREGGADNDYVDLFVKFGVHVHSAGFLPVLLVHEDTVDEPLAARIRESCPVRLPILSEPDPICLKGIIGTCALTLGSRFHGLVNALSQSVPSLGTSWSHKYEYLFDDYGIPDLLLKKPAVTGANIAVFERLVDSRERETIRRCISKHSQREKARAIELWNQVESLIWPVEKGQASKRFGRP